VSVFAVGDRGCSADHRAIYRDRSLLIILGVALILNMGVANVTAAFPQIGRALQQSPQSVGLLITAFTLPGILLTPVLGVLADRWGRRRIVVPCLMLFGLAGGGCALVRSFDLLLALRFLQGVGVSALGPLCVTMITDLYSGREHATAMGYYSGVLTVGSASYSAIGGALALLGWYYPFVLHFLALPVGLLVLFGLKNPEPRNDQGFKEYLDHLWKGLRNHQVIKLFAACLVAFIFLFGACSNYLPFLMRDAFQATPLITGLVMSGQSIASAVVSSQVGKLIGIWSEKTLLKAVFVLYGAALLFVPSVPRLWILIIPVLMFGVSTGVFIPLFLMMTARQAPMEHRSAFVAANEMVLFVGQTLGPVVIGAAFGLWGLAGAFYAGFAFAVVGFSLVTAL